MGLVAAAWIAQDAQSNREAGPKGERQDGADQPLLQEIHPLRWVYSPGLRCRSKNSAIVR